jgi:hypothetical protein
MATDIRPSPPPSYDDLAALSSAELSLRRYQAASNNDARLRARIAAEDARRAKLEKPR